MAINLCRVFFFLRGGEGGVPGFVKVFSIFLRSFRAYFWLPVRCSRFSIRCSGFSERCSGVFRVFWKLFQNIPGFLKGVPGCSGFSGTVRGVLGYSGVPVFCVPVFRCSGVPVFLELLHARFKGMVVHPVFDCYV